MLVINKRTMTAFYPSSAVYIRHLRLISSLIYFTSYYKQVQNLLSNNLLLYYHVSASVLGRYLSRKHKYKVQVHGNLLAFYFFAIIVCTQILHAVSNNNITS